MGIAPVLCGRLKPGQVQVAHSSNRSGLLQSRHHERSEAISACTAEIASGKRRPTKKPKTRHSERSEESRLGTKEILRCAQDDNLAGARFLSHRVARRVMDELAMTRGEAVNGQCYSPEQ